MTMRYKYVMVKPWKNAQDEIYSNASSTQIYIKNRNIEFDIAPTRIWTNKIKHVTIVTKENGKTNYLGLTAVHINASTDKIKNREISMLE